MDCLTPDILLSASVAVGSSQKLALRSGVGSAKAVLFMPFKGKKPRTFFTRCA